MAASSLLFVAGCATQSVDDVIAIEELRDGYKGKNGTSTHRLTYGSAMRDVSELPREAMIAVSETCNSTALLTEDAVDMTYDGFAHYDLIGGEAINETIYTFRCPESGKDT